MDARAYVILYGDAGNTGKLDLQRGPSPFETNKISTFIVESDVRIGWIRKVSVGTPRPIQAMTVSWI